MKYTVEILSEAVEKSSSMAGVLRHFGLQMTGGNYCHIKKKIKEYRIDTSHFTRSVHNKGKKFGYSYPLEDYLNGKRHICSDGLKRRLFAEGVKERRCEECGLTHWRGVEMSLELHHIDCKHNNNRLDNLMIVCPNCHWVIHNTIAEKKRLDKSNSRKKKTQKGTPKPTQRKVFRPPIEVLEKEIEQIGFLATGRKYGVSDNAIRKWLQWHKNGLDKTRTCTPYGTES